jgi:hypothetical protein
MGHVKARRGATYEDLVLHGHPHQLQQRLGLLGRQDVVSVDPLPVLQRSLELSVHHRWTPVAGAVGTVDIETASPVDSESVEQSLGTSDSFEVFQVLRVDQRGEDERLLEEGSRVGGIVRRIDMRRSPSLSGVFLLGQVFLRVVVLFELGVLLLTEETLELGHGGPFVDLGRRLVHEHRVDVPRLLIVPLLASVSGRARAEVVSARDTEKGPIGRRDVVCGGLFVGRLPVDGVEVVVPRVSVQDT